MMQDFERGIERLVGNWGDKITEGLIRELKHRYFTQPPQVWDRMITGVLDRCKYPPKMANFAEAMGPIRSEMNQKQESDQNRFCGKCYSGFTEIYFVKSEVPYRAYAPCSCHPSPPNLTEYQGHDSADRVPISEDEYNRRWKDIRARNRKVKPLHAADLTQKAHKGNMVAPPDQPPDDDQPPDAERTEIQAYEAEEEARYDPPPGW